MSNKNKKINKLKKENEELQLLLLSNKHFNTLDLQEEIKELKKEKELFILENEKLKKEKELFILENEKLKREYQYLRESKDEIKNCWNRSRKQYFSKSQEYDKLSNDFKELQNNIIEYMKLSNSLLK